MRLKVLLGLIGFLACCGSTALGVDEDFEPPLNYTWYTTSTHPWVLTTDQAHSGSYSARSDYYDDSTIWVNMYIQEGTLSFWAYTEGYTGIAVAYGYYIGSTKYSKVRIFYSAGGEWIYCSVDIDPAYANRNGFFEWHPYDPSGYGFGPRIYIDDVTFPGGGSLSSGIDTIGAYNPASATFFLRNSNSAGVADITFNYGIPNWVPIVGDWDGDGASTSSLSYKVLPIESESLQISCTPNPLKGDGLVTFSVAGEVEVQAIRVKVFDLAGQLIWQNEAAGNMLTWKAEDLAGQPLANGVYLYVVEVKTPEGWKTLEVRKLVILR